MRFSKGVCGIVIDVPSGLAEAGGGVNGVESLCTDSGLKQGFGDFRIYHEQCMGDLAESGGRKDFVGWIGIIRVVDGVLLEKDCCDVAYGCICN